MLRGYTLTDLSCDRCHTTPLMRESAGAAANAGRAPIQFCAQCDGPPNVEGVSQSSLLSSVPIQDEDEDEEESEDDKEEAQTAFPSRTDLYESQTRNTPAQSGQSDTDTGPAAPSASENAGNASDAAESISNLLLRGYSLLGTNCPQPSCRAIPLVGYPRKKDGSKDGRRMCVSCGGRWVDENDLGGMRVVPAPPPSSGSSSAAAFSASAAASASALASASTTAPGPEPESPRSKARRELYEQGERLAAQKAAQAEGQAQGNDKGKAREIPAVPSKNEAPNPPPKTTVTSILDGAKDITAAPIPPTKSAPNARAVASGADVQNEARTKTLQNTSQSLLNTLDRLATSLDSHSPTESADQARYFVDVKLHTEAIKDVLEVLSLVDRVRE